MYIGVPNPNILMPLEKMKIKNLDKGKSITVLYNPQSYVHHKSVNFSQIQQLNADAPLVQFQNGGAETLSFELFFDGVSSGSEVGGGMGVGMKFAANSLLPTATSLIDIRDYTDPIVELMHIDNNVHRPPLLQLEWSSLQFKCFLADCTQTFTKFNEKGKPVRARLQCQFIQFASLKEMASKVPLHSPDTTKYRSVRDNDSLWAMSAAVYGDPGQWRVIAAANDIRNPRALHSGDRLVIPAIE